jgi:dihydroorotate dehydrogenase
LIHEKHERHEKAVFVSPSKTVRFVSCFSCFSWTEIQLSSAQSAAAFSYPFRAFRVFRRSFPDRSMKRIALALPGFLSFPCGVLDFIYRRVLRPILFRFDAERVHHAAMAFMHTFGPAMQSWHRGRSVDARDERTVFGLKFPNAVGLAAGFDKNAHVLPAWEGLGFGFAEIGTVTALAQPGNPRPRLFRVPEIAGVINRMGFNNDGAAVIADRLAKLRKTSRWPRFPVGINLGKSKVTPLELAADDYLESFRRLQELGDYFVLNVSSPNTPGLRSLQDRPALDALFRAVQGANAGGRPLLVKIAPDLPWEAIEDVLALVEAHGLAGVIATNTTIDHRTVPPERRETGGLSGAPVRARSTEIIRFLAGKSKVPIIGVGGIFTADDAREKIDAGAALVQLYTGYVYRGPALVREIVRALRKS